MTFLDSIAFFLTPVVEELTVGDKLKVEFFNKSIKKLK